MHVLRWEVVSSSISSLVLQSENFTAEVLRKAFVTGCSEVDLTIFVINDFPELKCDPN